MNAVDNMNLNVICHCHCGASETPAPWKMPSGPVVSIGDSTDVAMTTPPACELVNSESIFPDVLGDARAPPVPLGESSSTETNPRTVASQLAASFVEDFAERPQDNDDDVTEDSNGAKTFAGDANLPLMGSPLRVGEVYHLGPDTSAQIEKVTLSLHVNGFSINPCSGAGNRWSIAWSPFALVQACRLHSARDDRLASEMQLFKITVFQFGSTFFFAVPGGNANEERARWVADISRSIRELTLSLIPPYQLSTQPMADMPCTDMRLLAGYMCLCESQDVMLIYCELRSHWNFGASIVVYDDENCRTRIMNIDLSVPTIITERVGIDCSCFSLDGYHLSVRSAAEKTLWLRAINNVKVKLKHRAENPTQTQLEDYRAAIWEYASRIRVPEEQSMPLLPLRSERLPGMMHVSPSRQVGALGPDRPNSLDDDRLAEICADEPPPPEEPDDIGEVEKDVQDKGEATDKNADVESGTTAGVKLQSTPNLPERKFKL